MVNARQEKLRLETVFSF
ncbi:hypothetical protein CGLO_18032 [Colletotrichum gloeosporioides Cg-14]|uniref:Uncharacterized protein n=1 Tax=Colletotrichum gloeosporioides (strain Cg-14) TaxID=1237896 RepID=T0JS48_COLGC|nr:hypothetical protein CGLO_18032 [Colletotrichum gloeosporioides Cg-14]